MNVALEKLNKALMMAQFKVSELDDQIEAEVASNGCISGMTAALCDEAEGFENGLIWAIEIVKFNEDGIGK